MGQIVRFNVIISRETIKCYIYALKNREKMKDDAIAQLSDQIMALTARMQEIERKQQPYVS